MNHPLKSNQIILAPMEGLIDHPMRELITAQGGFDYCVTEFVRVVNLLLPSRVFYKMCPELKQGGKTLAGTPCHIQLLGSDPVALAENAHKAVELGAPAIDLNFGCPAKTVNNSQGGAVLLKDPNNLYPVVEAVRRAVPDHIPVTAKMRLGFESDELALDNALSIQSAGADRLTIHARTKVQGYKPPAYWRSIAPIRHALSIPVIANGEVWTKEQFLQCREESECDHVMIGRGAIRRPDIAKQILEFAAQGNVGEIRSLTWSDILQLVSEYFVTLLSLTQEKYAISRLKQWLNYLTDTHPESIPVFTEIKKIREAEVILSRLACSEITKARGFEVLKLSA